MSAVPGAESETEATGAGGGSVTVTEASPVCPSAAAAIVADPAATAVTTPLAETVASAGSVEDHVTLRPTRTLPAASRSVAVACVVCPTVIEAVASATVMVATGAGGGGETATAAEPETPSTVAVTVVLPWPTAVSNPDEDSVATAGFALVHCVTRCVSAAPVESFALAISWAVPPTDSCTLDGSTATEATGTVVTVNAVDADTPSVDAEMVVVPVARVLTRPDADTVAIDGFELCHTNVFPPMAVPDASSASALSCADVPIIAEPFAGVMDTEATGFCATATVVAPIFASEIAEIVT